MDLFRGIFGDGNYYVELQNHGLENEKRTYPMLAEIAKEKHIPLVAANDAHMPDNSERSITMRNVARFLRFVSVDENPEVDGEMYIKSPNELAEALLKILPENIVDEAMMNLNKIGSRCTYRFEKEAHYPVYDKNMDADKLLREEAERGIEWRYPNGDGWDDTHRERMEYELGVISSMGFSNYHLVVQDFIRYARIAGVVPEEHLDECPLTIEGATAYVKEHGFHTGIGVGIGRGSGAGSLVTYLLGITGIDPFKYDLMFERFLNPERVSMPK